METLYAILPLAGRYILVAGLLMALYWMLWRKQATHRAKRIYLLALPFMALAITLIQIEVYKPNPVVVTVEKKVEAVQNISIAEAIPMTTSATTVASTEVNEAEEATPVALAPMEVVEESINLSTWDIITIVYISILVALCIPFVVGFVQLKLLSKKANKQQDKEKNIRILTGQAIKAPFSFYRSIFLPSNLTDTQRRMILSHEEAHIQHRHYLDMWISALVTRLFWWNPFLWWANNELRNIHEFEADGVVLNTGEDLYTYQTILIEEVMHGDIVIANGFNHSFIRRRFIEMAKSTNRRMSKWAKAGTGVWMLLIVALFCCSVGKAETIYKTVITHEPQELVAEAVTETAMEESPILIDTLTLSKDKPFLVFQDSVAILQADDDYMLFDDTIVVNFDESPLIVEANNLEQAEILESLLSTMGSLQEITPEQYEKLQTQSNRPLPSLESINQSMRNIKLNMNNRFSESLSRLLLDMVRTQNSFLTSSQLADLVDKESGVAFISPTLPKTFEFQSQLVGQLMIEWLLTSVLTEEAYNKSKEASGNREDFLSYEEMSKLLNESRQRRITMHLNQIKQADESVSKQVEEQMAKYGMSPKEDVIEIPITFKGGKVMIYKKDGNGFRSYEANSRQAAYENIRKAKENEFVIEGFVDENITDSCYNIYLADEHFLIQDEPVATVPVVNKRFTYVVNIDKMTAGRLRCIFPGGELCEATIALYFVPGETVRLFVHNGHYDLSKSEEYGNKVTRAMEIAREETNWETPHQPKIKGDAWKEVSHDYNNGLVVKEVYFNDDETVLRIAHNAYAENMVFSKNDYITDENGNKYKLKRAMKGLIGENNEQETRIFGAYLAFEPLPKDVEKITFHGGGTTIKNIRKQGKVIY
ncbi:MAG: M56 family metallopeptidase [Bacteroides sp.]|nr:M56 family metallopeptidase [Bacteroides sp.]